MSPIQRMKQKGVSLRTIHACLLVMAVVASAVLILSTVRSSSTFHRLSLAIDEYIDQQKAAYELMDASDYLTEMVQRFTLVGDEQYMNNYFREALELRHREDAIEKMSGDPNCALALEELKEAMEGSNALMEREYYAMKLVVRAMNITDCPEPLEAVTLTARDGVLSASEKMRLARSMVLDEEYYELKERVREDMHSSLQEVEKITLGEESSTAAEMQRDLRLMRTIIIVQAAGILFMIWLTARLGITPVLQAVDHIRDNNPIPVIGANEFRYLARTYNRMYEVYKDSVAHLNYMASHDELTGAYNRAGYELLVSSLDLKSSYMLLIDVDHFKTINDTHGHKAGDAVLKKVTETIRHNFRSDDYVCRIGGDEFVVFMVHAEENQRPLVGNKIKAINDELASTEDGLPPVSVSAGIAHGTLTEDAQELYGLADRAMYAAKHAGRKAYRFAEKE